MKKYLQITTLVLFSLLLLAPTMSFAQGWWSVVNKQFPAQTGNFIIEFDVVPRDDISVARTHITLSNIDPMGWGDNACIIRFVVNDDGSDGFVDVRNAAAYEADELYNYSDGVSYHVKMVVETAVDFYSVFVTELPGGDEVSVKDGATFRTDQAAVGQLQYINVTTPLITDAYNDPGAELKNIKLTDLDGAVLWEDPGTEYVPSADFEIAIDAQRDDWYNTLTGPADGWIYLSPESEGTTGLQPDDEFDCSAQIWQAWDENYYYFYAEVVDDIVLVNNATVYENDAIEQKIDPDPNTSDESTTAVAATRMSALSADDADVPEAVQNVESGEMTGDWIPEEGDYARTLTDVGYNLEWRIPWDGIQQGDRFVTVGTGEIFGLAINVMDNDDLARDHVLRWASDMDDLVWNEPKRHGTVTFMDNNILSLSTENAITGEDSNTVDYQPIISAVAANPVLAPAEFKLAQNYPNPFNPTTTIPYSLPAVGNVMLKVYDLSGREVATIINNEIQQAGEYNVTFNASQLSSGVYFYQLQTSMQTLTQKMTLLR